MFKIFGFGGEKPANEKQESMSYTEVVNKLNQLGATRGESKIVVWHEKGPSEGVYWGLTLYKITVGDTEVLVKDITSIGIAKED